MINIKIELQNCNLSKTELAEEYTHKLPSYEIDFDLGKNVELSGYDIYLNLCVIIPVAENVQVLNKITGVNKKGKLKLNMIGTTNIEDYRSNTFRLAEVSFFGTKIFNINNLLVLSDEAAQTVGMESVPYCPEVMERICISMIDYFIWRRFSPGYPEMYLDGEMSTKY